MLALSRLGWCRLAAAAWSTLALTGCETIATQQLSEGMMPPIVGPVTELNMTLRTLPPPSRKVVVAVYNYADQTGQFKPTDNVQSLSKAVTQGATSVITKALQDTGNGSWFTVVEREKLDNLLKERRIIAEMRKTYLGEENVNPQALPPLLFAGILLEGGIIGYDSNLQTGGIGARLLGIGGDIKYRLDTITVYLRAVSTKTGQVLSSVVTHKTVASVGLSTGVFKFIAVDKILEGEAGFTKNEPEQLAVQQAIEKAVHSLVVEGSEQGLWAFSDKAFQNHIIQDYRSEQFSTSEQAALRTEAAKVSVAQAHQDGSGEGGAKKPSPTAVAIAQKPAQPPDKPSWQTSIKPVNQPSAPSSTPMNGPMLGGFVSLLSPASGKAEATEAAAN
jgi:curli production assembly/transport component CsgG